MRKLILVATCLVLLGGIAGGTVAYLANQRASRQDNVDYREVQELLAQKKGREALNILKNYATQLTENPPKNGNDWLPLTVQALEQKGDAMSLVTLYQKYPRVMEDNEDAALLIASMLLAQKKRQEYQVIRDVWANKVTKIPSWFVLDADALLVEGKREEAKAFLESRTFTGPDDTGRLVRLALLHAPTDLSESWNILGQALEKDPKNTDITSYRAQILESINKPSLARIEYLSAIQKNPADPTLVFQLGDFYRRLGHYALAVNAWRQGLALEESDQLWIKMLFWAKMTVGLHPPITEPLPTKGDLLPLITFIRNLPEDRFWDEAAFEKIPDGQRYLRTYQETFWLRLADALQRGDETQASEMLDFNTFHATSWAPRLEQALAQIIAYRRYGILHVDAVASENNFESILANRPDAPQHDIHEFLKTLQDLAQKSPAGLPAVDVPLDLQALLTSKFAYPAAFLAVGWLEAGLTFPIPTALPANFPSWVAFAYTQAIRVNRGPEQALQFATRQPTSDPLNLLIGELMITSNNVDAGLDVLQPLAGEEGIIGTRAAWLISQVQIQRKELAEAKKTIAKHPALAESVTGKESLARIALMEGDVTKADKLYGGLEKDSLEAKFYLARRAYSEKNYQRALKLTEQLVIEFPDNADLHKDLQTLRDLNQKAK